MPSSVEGINHELENVFIREDWEQGMQVRLSSVSDWGHVVQAVNYKEGRLLAASWKFSYKLDIKEFLLAERST